MNRRGSLEWSLETVGKLIFYALILVALIYMSMKLVEIFTHGEQDWRAKQNLKLLTDQIKAARDENIEKSVILQVPERTGFVAFDKGETGLAFTNDKILADACMTKVENSLIDGLQLLRPKQCGSNSCVCALRFDVEAVRDGVSACSRISVDVLKCEKFPFETIDDTSSTLVGMDIPTGYAGDWDMHFTAKGDAVLISEDLGARQYLLIPQGTSLSIAPATP